MHLRSTWPHVLCFMGLGECSPVRVGSECEVWRVGSVEGVKCGGWGVSVKCGGWGVCVKCGRCECEYMEGVIFTILFSSVVFSSYSPSDRNKMT